MSSHQAPVFRLPQTFKDHPAADRLYVVAIPDTSYEYCANKEDWKDRGGKLVAWVPPESIVDVRKPEFNFLASEAKGFEYRVKAKRLRGVVSYGLLVQLDEAHGLKEGDDAYEALGIKHYDPELNGGKQNLFASGDVEYAPPGVIAPKYDVESWKKYAKKLFVEGEPVVVTVKLHGCSSKYTFVNGKQYCSSRSEFKKEFSSPPKLTVEDLEKKVGSRERAEEIYQRSVLSFKPKKSLWWEAFYNTPSLKVFCEANPGYVIYGEVYGQVQSGFPYDASPGHVKFRAFDILCPAGKWLDWEQFKELCSRHEVPTVPILVEGEPLDFSTIESYASFPNLLGKCKVTEGCCVRPMKERYDARLGRSHLKIINPEYLEL